MTAYKDRSREELLQEKELLEAKFQEIKGKGLKLDMSRGKPSEAQLNLSMGMMDILNSTTDLKCAAGVDCRNYGILDGIDEAKELLAEDGGNKIQYVAECVGCGNNPQYFSQIFKKSEGITPGKWAEKMKK